MLQTFSQVIAIPTKKIAKFHEHVLWSLKKSMFLNLRITAAR